jgi:transcription initiation factor TFIIIB Brf1 subunit/transcription initiation factor TFIIB
MLETDANNGQVVCMACGVVVEDSIIVSEVAFSEAPSGKAAVYGSYVPQGASTCFYCGLERLRNGS